METRSRTLRLSDGHVTDVCEYGDPNGRVLFQLHGTPGCRLQRLFDVEAYDGFRVVMFDRPGYVNASRRPGRTIADGGREIAAVADALGYDRFAVLGTSGGAPYALAAAALFPERVAACASVVGFAPRVPEVPDFDWFANMADVAEELAAIEGEEVLRPAVELLGARLRAAVARDRLPGHEQPAPHVLANILPWLRVVLAGRDDGWIDDTLASVSAWEVDLGAIRAPTMIWGATGDDVVPFSHAEQLARSIAASSLVAIDGGHLSYHGHEREIIARLSAAWR